MANQDNLFDINTPCDTLLAKKILGSAPDPEEAYCMPHDELTQSLALISAPLSSRATTVAVWPFSDERWSADF